MITSCRYLYCSAAKTGNWKGLASIFSVEERALHHDQVIDVLLLYVNTNQNSKYFDSFKNQKSAHSIVPTSQPNAAVYAKYIKKVVSAVSNQAVS